MTSLNNYQPFDPLHSRPVNVPIFQSSTFTFDNLEQAEDIFSLKERNFVYTRGGNPTVNLLEKRLAGLEDGVDAVCFSSGMGAIASTLFSLLESGDTLLISDVVYGSTLLLTTNILAKCGIKVVVADLSDLDGLKRKIVKLSRLKVVFLKHHVIPP